MDEFEKIVRKIYNKIYHRKHKTTNDLLDSAHDILRMAELIETRPEHAMLWDIKVYVLRLVNDAFETGFYTGDAYNDLRNTKRLLSEAERKARKAGVKTWKKS